MRVHDGAFSTWLEGLRVDYGSISGSPKPDHPILQVQASPDRAFAAVSDLLIRKGWVDGVDIDEKVMAAKDFAVLPLPVVSFVRPDPQSWLEGSGVPKRFRRKQFDQATQQFEEHPWPGTYQTEYRLTLWSRSRYTSEYVREWIYSQLGKLGAGETELFLMVPHGDPWGTLRQALKLTSSADLSPLEGEEEQRFMRVEYSLLMNVLHFRLPSSTSSPVDAVQVDASFLNVLDPIENPDEVVTIVPALLSQNLFVPYRKASAASTWPTTGAASVALPTSSQGPLLKLSVEVSGDAVDLTNRPVTLDDAGDAILSTSFLYRSDAAVVLDVYQNDGAHAPGTAPAWSSAKQFTLPAASTWTRVHRFDLLTQPIFDVSIRGSGTATVVWMRSVSIRHVKSGTKLLPSSTTPGAGVVTYVWDGLDPAPYLLTVRFTATGATGSLTVQDDDTSPLFLKIVGFDDSVELGAVVLIQPLGGTLALVAPDSLSIASVYAQRYDGGYAGNDL